MMCFPSLVAAIMMFGLILCCILNNEIDGVFPSLVEATLMFGLICYETSAQKDRKDRSMP